VKKVSLRTLGAGIIACAAIVGCNNDAFKYRPGLLVRADTITVFALNGTPAVLPSGVNVGAGQLSGDSVILRPSAVPSDGGTVFDFALDINAQGSVVAYPAPLVVRSSARRVGLQKVVTPFDQITQAPNTGYGYDSVEVTLATSDVLLVQANRAGLGERCVERGTFGYDPVLYAKAQVISVNTVERSVKLRTVLNPNCGFRGLTPGTISGN
jgi:hypothetical protein